MISIAERMRNFADIIEDKLTLWAFGAGAFLWGATILILVLQLVVFLKRWIWPHWALFDLIHSLLPAPFLLWFASPEDWYGLHQVAKLVLESSIPPVTFVLAFLLIFGAIKIAND